MEGATPRHASHLQVRPEVKGSGPRLGTDGETGAQNKWTLHRSHSSPTETQWDAVPTCPSRAQHRPGKATARQGPRATTPQGFQRRIHTQCGLSAIPSPCPPRLRADMGRPLLKAPGGGVHRLGRWPPQPTHLPTHILTPPPPAPYPPPGGRAPHEPRA